MEFDKQLKFKSHKRMQVQFISNNVDVMTHYCLSSVAVANGVFAGLFASQQTDLLLLSPLIETWLIFRSSANTGA